MSDTASGKDTPAMELRGSTLFLLGRTVFHLTSVVCTSPQLTREAYVFAASNLTAGFQTSAPNARLQVAWFLHERHGMSLPSLALVGAQLSVGSIIDTVPRIDKLLSFREILFAFCPCFSEV